MSINLGIYDFFAYLVPGILYMFVFNNFLRSINWKYIDIISWSQSGQSLNVIMIVSLLVVAYVIGHIVDQITHRLYKVIPHVRINESWGGLRSIKERYPGLNIKFEQKDWTLLFTLIRQRNVEMAKVLDSFSANNIMLRNISFGLFVYSLTDIVIFFSTKDMALLINALFLILASLLAFSKSDQYRLWFLKDIFRASLEYGVNIDEVIAYSSSKDKKEVRKIKSKIPVKKSK